MAQVTHWGYSRKLSPLPLPGREDAHRSDPKPHPVGGAVRGPFPGSGRERRLTDEDVDGVGLHLIGVPVPESKG